MCVIRRPLRHGDDTFDAGRAIWMTLKSLVPKILRVMLLACRKPNAAQRLVFGKGQREGKPDRRAIGALALPLKAHRRRRQIASPAKFVLVCARVLRLKDQNRQAVALLDEVAIVGGEQGGKPVAAELVRLGKGQ